MGNSFTMLILTGAVLMVLCLALKRPILYLFGASDATYGYANDYITIYLLGTIFVMTSLGMNNFINAQGFGKMGMLTVLLGAVMNSYSGSNPDLRVQYGSAGRGDRHCYIAGRFRTVGLYFSYRQKGTF